MLAQARSKGRSGGYRSLHSDGGTQPTVPVDLHRLPNGSINYELFELRARQLRSAFLAAALAAGMRALSRALKTVAARIYQLLHGSPVAVPQRRWTLAPHYFSAAGGQANRPRMQITRLV